MSSYSACFWYKGDALSMLGMTHPGNVVTVAMVSQVRSLTPPDYKTVRHAFVMLKINIMTVTPQPMIVDRRLLQSQSILFAF